MRHFYFLLLCLVVVFFASTGEVLCQTLNDKPADSFPNKWVAGTVVDDAVIKTYGVGKCFVAEVISDEVFSRMRNKSYKNGCPVKIERLRYLKVLHRNADGKTQLGELVCNVNIADKLLRIFRKLYDADYKIEKMCLIDDFNADDERSMAANNTSCFNFRVVSGTKTVSKHGYGLAIDLNPRYNPYVHTLNGVRVVEPANGKDYAFNRANRKDIPYKIDTNDLAYNLFIAEGFSWGGSWRTMKDYQHFDYRRQ